MNKDGFDKKEVIELFTYEDLQLFYEIILKAIRDFYFVPDLDENGDPTGLPLQFKPDKFGEKQEQEDGISGFFENYTGQFGIGIKN